MPTLSHSFLLDLYTELLRNNHPHNGFEHAKRLILSGKEPLIAFSSFIKTCQLVQSNPDRPSRIDITFNTEDVSLSILQKHGRFGQRIIETCLRCTPTLVCEKFPLWMRAPLKASVDSNQIRELVIRTLDNTPVTLIKSIASKVKKLVDNTGNLVETVEGSFDFVYIKKENLSWTKQFFSKLRCDIKVLSIEVEGNEFGFLQVQTAFKNDTWKKNSRIDKIEKIILSFTLHRSNKPVIQEIVNTLSKSFPHLKNLVLDVRYNFIASSEMEKLSHGVPKKLTKIFEAFENTEIPDQFDEVKLIVGTYAVERLYSKETECPPRFHKVLSSFKYSQESPKECEFKKIFNYEDKKYAKLTLHLYLCRSPFVSF